MSRTESIKGDKIKALALAKECYAMKLELLTNATVVDDAIRFVSSHAATTEKDNAGYGVTLDKDEGSDIQRSEECCSQEQEQQHSTATNNSIF